MSQVLDKVRAKYPVYKDVPDDELALKIGEKYPAYLEQDQDFNTEYASAKAGKSDAMPPLADHSEEGDNAPVEEFKDLSADAPVELNRAASESKLNPTGDRSTTRGGGRAPLASWEETKLEVAEELTNPRVTTPKLAINPKDSPLTVVGKEAVNIASTIPEFFSSDVGVMGVVAGAAAPVVTAAAFTADMLKSLGEQVYGTYHNWSKMSRNEKIKALTDISGTGIMATLTGKHATTGALDEAIPARQAAKVIGDSAKSPLIPNSATEALAISGVNPRVETGIPNPSLHDISDLIKEVAPLTAAAVKDQAVQSDQVAATQPKDLAGSNAQTESAPATSVEPADPSKAEPEVKPKSVASVPVMITKAMEQQLRDRGIAQDQIDKLTPQEANEIISKPTEQPPAETVVSENEKVDETPKDPRTLSDSEIASEVESIDSKTGPLYDKLLSLAESDENFDKRGNYVGEAKTISDQIEPFSRRKQLLELESKRRATEIANKKMMEDRDKRVSEAPVFQKRNGWEIVKEGADYVLRHPDSKEDVYRGKLTRVREVADESVPDKTEPPPVESKGESIDTRTPPSRNEMEEDANDFIKADIGSKQPSKTADEAWSKYLSNTRVSTGYTPTSHVIGESDFKSNWELFKSNLENSIKKEPTPTETPAKAVEKVEDQVQKVASEEGPRPAKEVKSELVDRLEKAIEDAPVKGGKGSGKKISIDIPGDGEFSIYNNKEDLQSVLDRAKRISTNEGGEKPAKVKSNLGGLQNDVKNSIQIYGSAENAYKSVKRQIQSLEDDGEKQKAETLADEIYKSTKAHTSESKAEAVRDRVETYKQGAKSFQDSISKIEKIKRKTPAHLERLEDLKKRYSQNQEFIKTGEIEAEKLEQESAREKLALGVEDKPKQSATPDVTEKPVETGEADKATVEQPAESQTKPENWRRVFAKNSDAVSKLIEEGKSLLNYGGERLKSIKETLRIIVVNDLSMNPSFSDRVVDNMLNGNPNIVSMIARHDDISTSRVTESGIPRSVLMERGYEQEGRKYVYKGSPSESKIIGMGGAIPSEFEPSGGSPTAMKYRKIDEERQQRGLLPLTKSASVSDQAVMDRAMAAIDKDPSLPDRLVEELNRKPRVISDEENHVLLLRKIELRDLYYKSARDAAQAFDDAKQFPNRALDMAEHNLQTAMWSDKLNELEQASRLSGSERGRALRSLRVMANEDYSLAAMETQTRASRGGAPITEAERAELKKKSDDWLEANRKIQEYIDQKDRIAAERAAEEAHKELLRKQAKDANAPSPYIIKLAEQIGSKLKNNADAARERIKARLGKVTFGAGPLHELPNIKDYAIIGAEHLYSAGLDFAKWSVKMAGEFGDGIKPHLESIFEESQKIAEATAKALAPADALEKVKKLKADAPLEEQQAEIVDRIKSKVEDGKLDEINALAEKLARVAIKQGAKGWRGVADAVHAVLKDLIPDWDYRDTMDSISGHGKFTVPSKDAVSRALSDAKGQINEIRKIQEVIARKPVQPTGFQRGSPSDARRRLTKIYEEVKRKFGQTVTDPSIQLRSALQARETYYKNAIKDLEHEIATNKRIVKTKSLSPTSPKLEELKARHVELKAEHHKIFGDRKISDEQKLKMAMASAEKQATEFQRRIDAGEFTKGKKPSVLNETPELKAARAKRDAVKAQFEELRDLNQEYQDQQSAKRLESQRNSLEKSIADLEKKISTGDIEPKGTQVNRPASPELEELHQKRDALNEQLNELRNPKKSREEISLQAFKTRAANRIAELQDKLARKDFTTTPRKETVLDAEGQRLQAQKLRIQKDFEAGLTADRLKNRYWWEKALDWTTKYRRFGVLSSPVVIPKLLSAAVQRLTTMPLEDLIGGGLSKLGPIGSVASKAPLEGAGLNLKAEMHGFKEGFTQGLKDSYDILKKGHSDLDVLYGKANESYSGESELGSMLLALPGRIHGTLKAPVKRANFERAVERLGNFYAKQGLDVTDDLVKTRIATEAYVAANRSIFLDDNFIASKVSAFMSEKVDKLGHTTPGGKAWSTAARFALPITRVPANIVAETFQYAAGLFTGSARLASAMSKGIENLEPEQADLIMRELKKGSIGAAVLLTGYFNSDAIGGYYQPGKKRDPKDVKAGSIRAYGVDVPSYLLHNPLLETLQVGATIRRVADSKLRKKDKAVQGHVAGIGAAALGLTEQIPFVNEMIQLDKLHNPYTRGQFVGEQAKSMAVPSVVSKVAEYMDKDKNGNPIKRKPTNLVEHVESGIPGLRQSVPKAQARP